MNILNAVEQEAFESAPVFNSFQRKQRNESLKALLDGLERGLVSTLSTIGSVAEDSELGDTQEVTRIRALLAQQETRRLLEKDLVAQLKASLVSG